MNINGNNYLEFPLGNEHYAVSIMAAKEIISMMNITAVPKVPSFVKGVINLRGKIIPIIDLRIKFGLDERPYDSKTCIIIIETSGENKNKLMGVIVDTVTEVLKIDEAEIEPPPEFKYNTELDFIEGTAKVFDNIIWILNLEKIINSDELVLIDKMKKEK